MFGFVSVHCLLSVQYGSTCMELSITSAQSDLHFPTKKDCFRRFFLVAFWNWSILKSFFKKNAVSVKTPAWCQWGPSQTAESWISLVVSQPKSSFQCVCWDDANLTHLFATHHIRQHKCLDSPTQFQYRWSCCLLVTLSGFCSRPSHFFFCGGWRTARSSQLLRSTGSWLTTLCKGGLSESKCKETLNGLFSKWMRRMSHCIRTDTPDRDKTLLTESINPCFYSISPKYFSLNFTLC